MSRSRTVRRGNRLAVPRRLHARHFLYRTRAPAFAPEDVALIVQAVQRQWQGFQGRAGCHIEVFGSRQLSFDTPGLEEAFARMSALTAEATGSSEAPSVLACQWTPPHIDESYAGVAFYSTVLHTGPYPYVVQTFDMAASPRGPELPGLHTSSRLVSAGDAFVFDPTTPHWCMPQVAHSDCLLILWQIEVPDRDLCARATLLARLPQLSEDHDEPDFTFPAEHFG